MATSLWLIGRNAGGSFGDNAFRGGGVDTLTLCPWSTKIQNVVAIHRGLNFHIYTIASPKNQLLFDGFMKQCQQLLPYQINTFYVIPLGISTLCRQYFGYYLKEYYGAGYNGRYQLGVDNKDHLVQEIIKIDGIKNIFMDKICVGVAGWGVFGSVIRVKSM